MIVINDILMYNDSVTQPELPQENHTNIRELHPRDKVFDNIMDSYSTVYRRTKLALELSKAVLHPDTFVDDKVIIPVRLQFTYEQQMTVDDVSKALYDRFKRANERAKGVYRPVRHNNIDGDQSISPPIDLASYRLSKKVD